MEMRCVYCEKELIYPWERRRLDCDDCYYAISASYHEDLETEEEDDSHVI
ncbi:hypothetical protein [Bacillus taeanensis]|nr:hypothetical protein [Bacillus taeanensis]